MCTYVYRYKTNNYPWLYVGKSDTNLKARIKAHKKEPKFKPYLNNVSIYFIELDNPAQSKFVESYLIDKYKPLLNKVDKYDNVSSFILNIPDWKPLSLYAKKDIVSRLLDCPEPYNYEDELKQTKLSYDSELKQIKSIYENELEQIKSAYENEKWKRQCFSEKYEELKVKYDDQEFKLNSYKIGQDTYKTLFNSVRKDYPHLKYMIEINKDFRNRLKMSRDYYMKQYHYLREYEQKYFEIQIEQKKIKKQCGVLKATIIKQNKLIETMRKKKKIKDFLSGLFSK